VSLALAAGLAVSTLIVAGTFTTPASAQEHRGGRGDGDHRGNYRGGRGNGGWNGGWTGGYYSAPPVIYGSPYYYPAPTYYPPPVVYGPGFGLVVPGVTVRIR
jgi:hypothetical protein